MAANFAHNMRPRRSRWTLASEVSFGGALLILGFSFYSWGIDALANTPGHQHKRLAMEAWVARDYGAAVAEYKQAAALEPANAVIPYELGMVYKDLGKTTDAIDAWSQALRIDPAMRQASDALRNVDVEGTRAGTLNESSSIVPPEDSTAVRSLSWESLRNSAQ